MQATRQKDLPRRLIVLYDSLPSLVSRSFRYLYSLKEIVNKVTVEFLQAMYDAFQKRSPDTVHHFNRRMNR